VTDTLTNPPPPPPPAPAHVVVVIDENQSFSDIIGNPDALFVNSLAAEGTVFASYNAIAHPSQPNYLAMFSGSTQGVTDDNTYFFPTTSSLGGELQKAGYSFVGYAESGTTASYHEPWLSFGDSANDTENLSQFPTNDFNQLPTVSFVIPNLNDDMTDDLSVPEAQTVAEGDQWLSTNLGPYIQWAMSNNSICLFTFDEGQSNDNNHIATIAVGAGVSAGLNYQQVNDYSLLATIENFYGLPALANSANAPLMSFDPPVALPSKMLASLSGISDPSVPAPGNAMAVGRSSIVAAEGSKIEWTNLSGGAATTQSIYQFFNSLGAASDNSLSYASAAYDSINGRFIVTAQNFGPGGTSSNVDIAVSKDANPDDGWYFTTLNTTVTINGQSTVSSQPTLSVDGNNIYINTLQSGTTGSGFQGTEQWVVGDTAGTDGGIYNGGAPTLVANAVAPASEGDVEVVSGNNGESYYVSAFSNGTHTVTTVQGYNAAANTFGPASTISLGDTDQGGGGSDFTAQQQGTNLLLDAGSSPIQGLAYANGFLYGVSEVMPNDATVPDAHWFKMNVTDPYNPTVVAEGDITGAAIGPNVATFDGSIAVDSAGDIVINFTASGPNMDPADYYVDDPGGDPTYNFSAPILYQAGTGFYNSGNGATVQPWGGRSSAVADPNIPQTFWLSGEYVANGNWQTSLAQITLDTVAPTVSISDAGGVTNQANQTISGKVMTAEAAAGAAVSLFDNGVQIGTATLGPGGTWSTNITLSGDGTHSIMAKDMDAAGNIGASSAAVFTLDTVAPTVSIANAGGVTNQANQTISGKVTTAEAAAGATVSLFDNGAQIGTATLEAGGTWSTSITLSGDGTNSIVAGDTDAVGNTGTSSAVVFTLHPLPTSVALIKESNGALDYLEFAGANLAASEEVSQYTDWNIVAEGDFNHDGRTELIAQDPNSGAIDLLSIQNGGLQGSLLEQGDYWKVVGAGDFDGSGRTGIATQNTATGQVDLLWFSGTQLTESVLLDGSYQPVVGAADFNGDGKTDLVTQSQGGGPLDFLFFSNTALAGSFQTSESFWSVHDATNTGIPGQSSLLSQDPTSGQLDYLGFNGTALTSSQLESISLAGSTVLPGTQVAARLFA